MEKPFNHKYSNQSMRLQTWDYSHDGGYFVTICTKNREHSFGEIVNGKLTPTKQSEICLHYWNDLPNHYENCILDEFVIMPNHVHGIIYIDNTNISAIPVGAIHELPLRELSLRKLSQTTDDIDTYRKKRRQMTLSKIIGRFKMQTAQAINQHQNTVGQPFWQSRFHDRIIRNEKELNRIRKYIIENPQKWEQDQNNI